MRSGESDPETKFWCTITFIRRRRSSSRTETRRRIPGTHKDIPETDDHCRRYFLFPEPSTILELQYAIVCGKILTPCILIRTVFGNQTPKFSYMSVGLPKLRTQFTSQYFWCNSKHLFYQTRSP